MQFVRPHTKIGFFRTKSPIFSASRHSPSPAGLICFQFFHHFLWPPSNSRWTPLSCHFLQHFLRDAKPSASKCDPSQCFPYVPQIWKISTFVSPRRMGILIQCTFMFGIDIISSVAVPVEIPRHWNLSPASDEISFIQTSALSYSIMLPYQTVFMNKQSGHWMKMMWSFNWVTSNWAAHILQVTNWPANFCIISFAILKWGSVRWWKMCWYQIWAPRIWAIQ